MDEVLTAGIWAGVACVVLTTVAIWLGVRARRQRRIRLPARLVSKVIMPPGYLLTVEFPAPDGTPRRATVLSALRRGIGATPEFQGWVWVNLDNHDDVIVRPHARMFWPTFFGVAAGFALLATAMLFMIGATFTAAMDVMTTPTATPTGTTSGLGE